MEGHTQRAPSAGALRLLPRRLRIVDVALFYGERSGGIRTYLEAKAAYAAHTGAFEHHLVVPGRPALLAGSCEHRHEQRSLRLAASNGYRIPLGGSGLIATLRALAPDVVLLHDPYWTPRLACRAAHGSGAAVIAVHHSSPALHAAGLPGPERLVRGALRRWYRHAYVGVDAVMSVIDPGLEAARTPSLPLRFGLDAAFRPRPEIARREHVLYVGRLSREKGLRELLDAAAKAPEPWRLVLLGTGSAQDALRERSRQLGLPPRLRFAPYLRDRERLAREYARARCLVLPGAHETFGLAALEAAACGTPVVTASATPAAGLLGGLVEVFEAGDVPSLQAAIERARARPPNLAAAAQLSATYSWARALSAELSDLERLLGAS